MFAARDDFVKLSGFPRDIPTASSAEIVERLEDSPAYLFDRRSARHVDQIDPDAVRTMAIVEYFRYADIVKDHMRDVGADLDARSLGRALALDWELIASEPSST